MNALHVRTATLGIALSALLHAGDPEPGPIRPWRQDPRYWEYRGAPTLLLGGTKTDHIFLLDDLAAHLDELVKAGGNYVRSTMSQREGPDLKPHLRREDGKFDLDRWNEDYWKRFARCLELCRKHSIIIQVEVWDRFDFSQEHWQTSPWRPANNINYSVESSGLKNNYPVPPWRDRQPFFHTVKGMPLYRPALDRIRERQERFVAKILSYTLQYRNVLYCMDNETSTPPAWGRYWMQYIRERAAQRNAEVYTTDMFDDAWKPQRSEKLKQAFADHQAYPFVDVSQVNSRTFGENHWKNIRWIVEQARRHPRPLNHVKIYGDGETKWGSGTPADGVERFWRNLIAGSAAVRFHRDGAGIGLNSTAKACIRAVRELEKLVKLWEVQPRLDLLGDREADEAYLAATPGKAYVVYFTQGGTVTLNLKPHTGAWSLYWIDIGRGQSKAPQQIAGGIAAPLKAPGRGPWVAAILRPTAVK